MKGVIRAAGIQFCPSPTKEASLDKAEGLIRLASSKGAKIVCLPELFTTPWFPHKIETGSLSLAEPDDGPTLNRLREISKREKVVLIAPLFELDGPDGPDEPGEIRRYNTAYVLSEDGEITGKYRKVHVPQIPLWEERAYFNGGSLAFPVFDTPYGRIGVLLCWDVFFPEAFRVLALKGAEVVFAPTASAYSHSQGKWERAVQAAAHSNGIFVFRVNRVGKEARQEFYGASFLAGPDGEFVVKPAGRSEGVILADIDTREISTARNEWTFMKDRRPEQYGLVADKIEEEE